MRAWPILRIARPMIGAWSRRFPATAISPTGSTCSPTSPRSSASSRSASPPTGAPPSRIRDTASSVAELALEGKAKELPGHRQDDRGEDRRGRRDGGHGGAREAPRAGSRRGGRRSCACPGLGPEDRGADLARARRDDARRAEGGGGGAAAADARRDSAPTTRGEDPEGARRGPGAATSRSAACSATACPSCARWSRRCARTRPRSTSPRRAARAAAARRSATST